MISPETVKKAKKLSEEHKRKLSLAHMGKYGYWNGKHRSEETKQKVRLGHLGKKNTEESKVKVSESLKKAYKENRRTFTITDETRRIWTSQRKGKHFSTETEFKKGHVFPFELEEARIRNSLKTLRARPTSLESDFQAIIDKHKLPYRYTGDGSFIIGFKNPDFVNVNGEKICIDVRHTKICEVFDKITPEEYVIKRQEHFFKFGWKSIVFFENDVQNENKILEALL